MYDINQSIKVLWEELQQNMQTLACKQGQTDHREARELPGGDPNHFISFLPAQQMGSTVLLSNFTPTLRNSRTPPTQQLCQPPPCIIVISPHSA